jgi:hypothetical protein
LGSEMEHTSPVPAAGTRVVTAPRVE